MAASHAAQVASWRYGPPYARYDGTDDAPAALLDGNHVAILDDGVFVGYICTGLEARVPGGPAPAADVTDVGIGIRPDAVGQGVGTRAGALAIEALRAGGHERLRVCIAADNARSIALAERLGFERAGTFTDPRDETPFLVLERRL